jgi:hypothetical protein
VSNGSTPTSANADAIEVGSESEREMHFAVGFLRWPIIGFVGAVGGGWLNLEWLAPLGVGGLFCHYWLDGRIWTRRPVTIEVKEKN